ncbi:MAG TPA: PLP-dependent aminotransferase family protein [Steroidobacteraceae bacterium]|jgi:GntR family transcriptional regulator/MocR family aminotransferase
MLLERIDPRLETPLYRQVIHALIHEIQRGRLLPGAPLPSSRQLAQILGVNRKTIVLAYEDLIAQGWLTSLGTRGTVVSPSLPDLAAHSARLAEHSTITAVPQYQYKVAGPMQPLAGPQWLKLDEGSPDGRLFPPDALVRTYRAAIYRAARENRLSYADPRGSMRLRTALANMLRTERGLVAEPENICITRGSQMGVYLAARALVRPGDTVLVEALTYQPAVAVFRECGAHIVPVGLDQEGVNVEDVERMCRLHRVCAIFLTPHHQFPTTVALQPDRRLRLLELARQFSFAVIEDDYDYEFHFATQPLLPMASYAPERVIYIGSLSKLVLPALRIGYVVAPSRVVDALAQEVMLVDSMGNTLTEDAVAELLDSGEVRRQARAATKIYARRRKTFAATLTEEMGELVEFDIPDGGLAFWVRFRNQELLDRIDEKAPGKRLWVAPSRSFVAQPGVRRGLRLGFASLNEREAREAIRRLRAASQR